MRDLKDGVVGSGGRFRLVGRQPALGQLLAAVRNPPAVVLVEGEAGVGKSRLVNEAALTLRAERHQVLTGFCHPLREPFPYGPVLDALGRADLTRAQVLPSVTGALARLLPDLAELLPPAPPTCATGQSYQLFQAVRSFLTALGPTVLVVEDLHWADDATRELLLLLARDLPPQLGLVLTYRAEDLAPGSAVLGAAYLHPPGTRRAEIRLGPLSEPEVRELAAAVLGPNATGALGAALYRRSQGLPLVVEEDLITLTEQGGRPGGADATNKAAEHAAENATKNATELLRDADAPRGLREVVLERLGTLSPDAVAIAEAAAVLAVPAPEELLAALARIGEERSAEALTELLRASLLRDADHGDYAFRHVLAQQVVHQQIPAPARLRLHRRAVETLRTRTPLPLVQIAHHTLAGGDRAGWLLRAQDAAYQAIAVRDGGTAATLLHQLLDRPELEGEARARAALALAGLAAFSLDFRTHARLLRRLLDDLRLPQEVRGEIRLGLGLGLLTENAVSAGFEEVERVAEEATAHPELAVRAMVALALRNAEGPEYTRAWLERAERAVRDSDDEALKASVHASRLTWMTCQGDPEVWELVDRLPRRADDPGVLAQTARALINVANTATYLGHDRRAAPLAAEARQIGTFLASPIAVFLADANLLWQDGLAGRWDGLERRVDSLLDEYPTAASFRAEGAFLTGTVAAARGQRATALERFGEAFAIGAGQQLVDIELWAAAGLSAVHLAGGDAAAAWAVAERAVATARRASAWPRTGGLLSAAVEAALACGRREYAERLGAEFERELAGRDAPAAVTDLELVRGLLLLDADPGAAAEHFAAAARGWREIGRPHETARALERESAARRRAGLGAAAEPLTSALAIFTELGATADVARCERGRHDLGLLRRGPGRRGYGKSLSPREHQVAELLAAGAANQRIAEALSLSPRTAENHVANVLKKLGTSRRLVATVYPGSPENG